jgi:hypothetical protein
MPDDNVTDPAGMSGDRLACGVVVAGAPAPPRTGAAAGGAGAGPAAVAGAGALLAVLGGARHRRGRLPAR